MAGYDARHIMQYLLDKDIAEEIKRQYWEKIPPGVQKGVIIRHPEIKKRISKYEHKT